MAIDPSKELRIAKKKQDDTDTGEKIELAHEIKNFFTHNYKNEWVSEKQLKYHSRTHNQVFNDLVRRGFIERKKTFFGYSYKWKPR
jgi:hypothetical protein